MEIVLTFDDFTALAVCLQNAAARLDVTTAFHSHFGSFEQGLLPYRAEKLTFSIIILRPIHVGGIAMPPLAAFIPSHNNIMETQFILLISQLDTTNSFTLP